MPPNPLDDAVSVWTLDEVSGTRYDSRGTFHLTDNGGVGSVAGKRGLAADIASNSLSIAHAAGMNMGVAGNGATWSLWFRKGPDADVDRGLFLSNVGSNRNFSIKLRDTGGIWAVVYDSLNNLVAITTSTDLRDGAWHLVMVTWNPTDKRLRIYVDSGAPRLSVPGTVKSLRNLSCGLNIGGGLDQADYLQGQVDEVAMWNRCLSAAEVVLYGSY
jgi:YD repeat-containing protein